MKWIKNLNSLAVNGNVGQCPFCNSDDTDSSFITINKKSGMGYEVIWCNKCKHAFRVSRIKVSNEMEEKEIPKDLIF